MLFYASIREHLLMTITCHLKEDKMAAHAENHAKNVAANIVLEAAGKPVSAQSVR